MIRLALFVAALGCSPAAIGEDATRAAESATKPMPFGFHDLWDYSQSPVHGMSPSEIAQLAKWSAQAGATVNRFSVNWNVIESTPPCVGADGSIEHHYDEGAWSHLRAVVDAHASYGIRPLLLVSSAPGFAAIRGWAPAACGSPVPAVSAPACADDQPCSLGMTADHAPDFAAFITALIARFPGAVGLEIFNEPNSSRFWGPKPDPSDFASALHGAFDGRNAAHSKIPVVLGGLAMGSEYPYAKFLEDTYAHGVAKWIDGIGLHPYPNKPPWVESMWDRIRETLAVRNKHDTEKPIWITEVGIGGSDALAGAKSLGVVRANREGELMLDLYRSTRGKPGIAMFIFYSFRDWPTELGRHAVEGLLTQELHRKPAYCQLARGFHQKAELCQGGLPRCDEMGGALCEAGGNSACGGVGPRSYECDHCCGGSL